MPIAWRFVMPGPQRAVDPASAIPESAAKPAEPAERRPSRKRRYAWLFATVALVVAAVGFVLLRPTPVEVAIVTRGAVVQTVVSSGRVLPPAEIQVGALVSATVERILVAEGAEVAAGDLLIELDDDDARAAVAQARAALAHARAGLVQIMRLSEPVASSDLRRAETTLRQAERDAERQRLLYGGGATTRLALEQAEEALAVARTEHRAAELNLRSVTRGGSQQLAAAATVAQEEARVARALVELERTKLRAPASGTVLAVDVEVGDAVHSGTRLLLLARTGETRLMIEPDERNLASLELGQAALASAEAFPDRTFPATVSYIAPAVDPQRGTVEVRLIVAEPPAFLRAHMTVSVEVRVGSANDALLVPSAAVRGLGTDRPWVFALNDGRLVRREVTLGTRGEEMVEVEEGLVEGDRVVTSADPALRDGLRAVAED